MLSEGAAAELHHVRASLAVAQRPRLGRRAETVTQHPASAFVRLSHRQRSLLVSRPL